MTCDMLIYLFIRSRGGGGGGLLTAIGGRYCSSCAFLVLVWTPVVQFGGPPGLLMRVLWYTFVRCGQLRVQQPQGTWDMGRGLQWV